LSSSDKKSDMEFSVFQCLSFQSAFVLVQCSLCIRDGSHDGTCLLYEGACAQFFIDYCLVLCSNCSHYKDNKLMARITELENFNKLRMVAHACDPSYLEG
jgi:hypothetical protein